MKKILMKVASVFSSLLLLLSFIIMISVVFLSSNQKVTTICGYTLMRIVSSSMTPDYPVNCYILVKKIEPNELQEGNVITFFSDDPAIIGLPNTHRIKKIIESNQGRSFITKGDNNNSEDIYPVSEDKIIGKVVVKLSFLSVISGIVSNQYIFFALIVIPLIFIMIHETIKLIKDAKKKEIQNKDHEFERDKYSDEDKNDNDR